jgi:hypothetical protein
MPDREGDAHHPRRPFVAVLSLGAFIGMPPVTCGVSHPITYQNDITFYRCLLEIGSRIDPATRARAANF